jgi:hypothetical protein
MIQHGFDMYRVFVSTPGDLVREQDACRAAISEANEQDAMPKQILLVTVGLREEAQIAGFRAAVSENVRMCTYFVQVFADDWGPDNLHLKVFRLAAECRDDVSFPMREVIVFLKDAPHETDPVVLAFRKELEGRSDVRVLHFDKPARLQQQLQEVCGEWVKSIVEAGGGVPASV